jgi:hypothetical protein
MRSLDKNDYLVLNPYPNYANVNHLGGKVGTFYHLECPKFNLYEKSY